MDGSKVKESIDQLREELRKGRMQRYRSYYESFREEYLRFARRYSNDEDLIADSYQDAFIAFYENVIDGKVSELRSSVKTYVFSIAKYTLYAKLRKRGREVPNELVDKDMAVDPSWVEESERELQLREGLSQLSEGCREILVLFYYKRYTIESIMHTLGYKNENTAKANKSRCLRRLREIMKGNT